MQLSAKTCDDDGLTRLDPSASAAVLAANKISLQPGALVEHYEIIRELGRGGMGVVYLARDNHLGRRVAIKFLAPRYVREAERFLLEARATAQCHHENIVVIHAVNSRVDGVPYMVLEYLEGASLHHYLDGRRFPATKAVEMMVPVVRAVVHAHAAGIVHRDLKPANIFVTRSGVVKVLDFGIAKALADPEPDDAGVTRVMTVANSESTFTELGREIGTASSMAPEQWGIDSVDVRTDIWAIGLILYTMVAGVSPLAGRTVDQLRQWVRDLDDPVPSVGEAVHNLPDEFVAIVDRCLKKRKDDRFDDAQQLLDALELLLPGRFGRALGEDECPYPGLAAFQQSDADRYFGRAAEIRRGLLAIEEHPLLAVVGPSGLGKSSFVRAGLMPALRSSGESWEMFTIRPGRHPLASLASLCSRIETGGRTRSDVTDDDDEALVQRLRSQPGFLGVRLRERARRKEHRVLVLVDQFEELYTLVADPEERAAFASCLVALADDGASPLRVVVSMRSDFLDRVAEHPQLSEEMTRGLMLLPAMDRAAIRAALIQPAELAGYRFEDEAMVDTMLAALESTPGALSLLQFAAARLWDARDRRHKLLTRDSYDAIGGIAGTLAAHADATLSGLAPAAQKLARKVFQRLVTPERTRALVDLSELAELTEDPNEVIRVVNQLVQSRLLVTDVRGERGDAVVELVHESLITSWPTLLRWLDESEEDAIFLAQLRDVARQWEARGRPAGLLWRGEALEDARRFVTRYRGELAPREQRYVDAALWLANRSARLRRGLILAAFGLLTCLVVGAAVALVEIRKAERQARQAEHVARESEEVARHQAAVAQQEALRAQVAQRKVNEQLELLQAEEKARRIAESMATDAAADLGLSNAKLAESNQQLHRALQQAERAAQEAVKATEAERALSLQLEKLLDQERSRVQELERKRGKIIDDLR